MIKFTSPYDHLNKTNPVYGKILDIDKVAKIAVVESNYGTIRLLAALIRALEDEDEFYNKATIQLLKDAIKTY